MREIDAEALLDRVVETWTSDDRIVAAFLGGSHARGEADAHSDLDLSVIVADGEFDEVIADRAGFVRRIGEPRFLEDFGNEHVAFVILDDGAELELMFFRASGLDAIRSGPHRVLLDPHGILDGRVFPGDAVDPEAQEARFREVLQWFWHEIGHFVTAVGRGQLWWAAGQLEALRHHCVTIARIEQGAVAEDEPYWKLDVEISTAAVEPLRATFVPIERDAMVTAARELLAWFRAHAPAVARAYELEYPEALDRLVGGHLDALA